jgi:4-alpha-glucanotransferase
MARRRRVLEALAEAAFASPSRRAEIEAFARSEPQLDDYARFRATAERHRAGWPAWPERQRASGLAPVGLAPPDFDEAARRYHLYAQWLWDHQFRTLFGGGEALYLDLPIGVDGGGFDVWRFRDQFAAGAAVGAPSDRFFAAGQDWGFPPPHPHHGRQTGHAYFRSVVRAHLRRAGMLRLDHVMALHRLFWIPRGFSARDGVYVRYPADELYAVLAIESHRHRARIVGENLGTVPPEVNESMQRRGLLPMRIFQFEATPDWPRDRAALEGLAALNTHDTATFAAFWEGRDVEQGVRLGLLDAAAAGGVIERRARIRAAVIATLAAEGWLDERRRDAAEPTAATEPPNLTGPTVSAEPPTADDEPTPDDELTAASEPTTDEVLRALLRRLAASDAEVVIAQLEDLWLEPDPQNVPGVGADYPSWHRRMRRSLDSIERDPSLAALLRELAALRQGTGR